MQAGDFLVDARALRDLSGCSLPPLVLLDLESCAPAELPEHLPACPVIGIGEHSHPLARAVDALIEGPVSTEMLVRSITRNPAAAAVFVQLLRLIGNLPMEQALVAESLAYAALQGGAEHARWLAQARRSAPSDPGILHVEREGATLSLEIDRPWARNAIDVALRDALCEAFELAALDPTIERIDLRGAGKVFSVGAELSEFGTTRDPVAAHRIRMQSLPAQRILGCRDKLQTFVQGACAGSALEMAAFASRIEARSNAWFHLPELSMGIIPGAGGCVSLSHRIGHHRTALMVLSGRRINAQTALDWGLVDAIMD